MSDILKQLENINTDGTMISTNDETGRMIIKMSKKITPRAFNEVSFYLYMDETKIDQNSEKDLIIETRDVCFCFVFIFSTVHNFYFEIGCKIFANRKIGKNM